MEAKWIERENKAHARQRKALMDGRPELLVLDYDRDVRFS